MGSRVLMAQEERKGTQDDLAMAPRGPQGHQAFQALQGPRGQLVKLVSIYQQVQLMPAYSGILTLEKMLLHLVELEYHYGSYTEV